MKKILIITLITLLLIFVVGCKREEKVTAPRGGYIGGTEGLALSYITEAPPAEVLDDSQEIFAITLLLENKGEHTIQPNEVIATLTGLDNTAFNVLNPTLKNLGVIEGKRILTEGEILEGGQSTDISFDGLMYKPDLPVSSSFTYATQLCYKYKTRATSALCLRRDVTKKPEPTECKVTDPITAGNSGAPVQITSMSQGLAGKNSLLLTLHIDNVGTGRIYSPNFLTTGQCLDDPQYKDRLHLSIEFTDGIPVSCGKFGGASSGELTLIQDGRRQILTCTIDTSNLQETAFTKSPNIELDYVYRDHVSGDILVKSIL